MKNMIAIFSALLLLLLPVQAQAAELSQITANLPPYTIDKSPDEPGFTTELLAEVHKRAGLPYNPKFMPWPRAQVEAQKEENTHHLIFTVTRTSKREPLYKWIFNVLPVKTAFVSVNGKSINSIEEAVSSGLRIGVARSTPWLRHLEANNVPSSQIKIESKEQSNAKKLLAGRVDLWFVPADRGSYYLKKLGLTTPPTIGAALKEGQLFLAANLKFPDDIADKLRAAFEEVKADGTYDKIYKKYFGF